MNTDPIRIWIRNPWLKNDVCKMKCDFSCRRSRRDSWIIRSCSVYRMNRTRGAGRSAPTWPPRWLATLQMTKKITCGQNFLISIRLRELYEPRDQGGGPAHIDNVPGVFGNQETQYVDVIKEMFTRVLPTRPTTCGSPGWRRPGTICCSTRRTVVCRNTSSSTGSTQF